ncbi:choline/carnitine O-acyltransferase [Thermovirga sp.]|uniref:choline/carnitine O-acyltransferase n=1 Tax=Thermovirga sp. TaxID=2699834 RepID=UPI0025DCA205|nr:choline/carnitine O-acyltransferase [Thermovirga sp.]MBO8153682.1 choline/carnitine O-acyltransferase [Thermovirga sp.]
MRNMPKLPVPPLEETKERYIPWIAPFVSADVLEEAKKCMAELLAENSSGLLLQRELVKFAQREDVANWLEPFWIEAYLSERRSLPLYSDNVFYKLALAPTGSELERIWRAASLCHWAGKFYDLIRRKELTPDWDHGQMLCMSQYELLFGTTRIPRKKVDEIISFCAAGNAPFPTHITIMSEGNIAFVHILDEDGNVLPVERIASGLLYILDNLKLQEGLKGAGVFTALPREEWAAIWEDLERVELNQPTLEKIKSSLFVMSFDDASPRSLKQFPIEGLVGSGENRWLDKSFSIIVFKDGQVGVTMEHTCIDGSIMVRLCSYLVSKAREQKYVSFSKEDCLLWERGILYLNDILGKKLVDAKKWLASAKAKSFFRVIELEGIGRSSLRSRGLSPDAFCQLALQLAHYKISGEFVNSYETVMMRHFYHGRTEALRTVTSESKEFVMTMLNPTASVDKKMGAFLKAKETHKKRIVQCKSAKGVERHLFGLKSIYEHRDMFNLDIQKAPSLFESRSWKILNHSVIATSTSSTDGLELVCYGPVVEDGFGGRYLVFDDKVFFCLSCREPQAHVLEDLALNLVETMETIYNMAESFISV